jgi:two-component system, OmpR family, phosphate regulon sensor histidine kinase PhoR
MNVFQRKYLVPAILILLFCLFFIQVRWINYTIRTQEQIFRRSVNLALSQTITSLNENRNICSMMKECVACDTLESDLRVFSSGIWDQIQKTIDAELKSYSITLKYDLFIIKDNKDTIRRGILDVAIGSKKVCYTQSLGDVLQKAGYELVVRFPGKSRLFFRNTGLMFLSSVFIIILIVLAVIYIMRLYKGQLQLAENIKELINNMSHEFKTPLSSIALAASLIKKGNNNGKINEYAQLIQDENKKLLQQVEGLLDLSAIERNDLLFRKKIVEVNDLIGEAVSGARLLVQEKEGTLIFKPDIQKIEVEVDRLHMVNVFLNLLSNSVKYSVEKPEIIITAELQTNDVLIHFTDNGIGIPLKYQKFIFDKYFRVPTGYVHDIKGFGIGLSYVKMVVEAHHGEVKVVSVPDKGSTFTVRLPLVKN